MRSSREKLKLLRSLGSRPNGISTSARNHHQPNHHSISRTSSPTIPPTGTNRTLRNNNNRQTSKSTPPPQVVTQFRGSATASVSVLHNGRESHRQVGEDENVVGLPRMETVELTGELRGKAFNICRDYLHGAWKQIDLRDLVIKRVSGGMSNYLYHCSLPLTLTPIGNEPSQVLLRFYGQVHGEDALESLITESVIFALLSERKLGPKLYGVFPGGRIEQFFPARPLLTNELRDPRLSDLISQKMAQIHALHIPISKEASWLWGTMERWMKNIRENVTKTSHPNEKQKEIILKLAEYNLDEELLWLRNFLSSVGSPVVFSHNDLQEGNILIRPEYETIDDKIVLIDFEYCSYNYRGFDLANHFCEWSFNYVEPYPIFSYIESDLPSDDEKIRFISSYVATLRAEYEREFPEGESELFDNSPLFNTEHILKEVEAFTLASHFFWSLWAIVNGQVSKIPFSYSEYGLCRLEIYFNLKKRFA